MKLLQLTEIVSTRSHHICGICEHIRCRKSSLRHIIQQVNLDPQPPAGPGYPTLPVTLNEAAVTQASGSPLQHTCVRAAQQWDTETSPCLNPLSLSLRAVGEPETENPLPCSDIEGVSLCCLPAERPDTLHSGERGHMLSKPTAADTVSGEDRWVQPFVSFPHGQRTCILYS